MGNQNRKEQEGKPQEIRINHEKFSHFVFHEQEELIEINLEAESEKDIKRWTDDLRRVNGFQDKETLLLPTKHQYKSKGFCGNSGSVRIFYQNYPYLFEEQIENRIQMGKHFEQVQLWYLLYSLVSSARDFAKIDSKIGDVRPYNIFINEEGQIKIANLYSWPYEKTNFEKTAFEKELTYVAPQEIRQISKGNHENTTNKIVSESFSIGLTLLQSGLLFNAKNLYSVEHFSIDLQQLGTKLGDWENLQFVGENNAEHSYSPLLKRIVVALCHPDEKQRLTSLEVEERLRPFENQIVNLKQFDHNSVKLSVKVEQVPIIQTAPQFVPPPQQVVQSRPLALEVNATSQQKYYQSLPPQLASMVTVPQKTYITSTQIEPKINLPPPPAVIVKNTEVREIVRPVAAQTSIRFNQGQPINIEQNGQYLQGQFIKYAANQVQTNFRPQSIPIQSYEQQFYKYAGMNQNPSLLSQQRTVMTSGNTGIGSAFAYQGQGSALNQVTTSFNPPVYSTTVPVSIPYNPQYTTSQFTRQVGVAEIAKVGPSFPSSTVPAADTSSDFLRKIDEQLQASRRQFPS